MKNPKMKRLPNVLLISLLIFTIKAQNQTPLENWLQEFLDYKLLDVKKEGAVQKSDLIWRADVLKKIEKVQVVADFTSPVTFMGVKKVAGKSEGQSGIEECTSEQECELGEKTTMTFKGKSYSECYKGKLPFRLDGRQTLSTNSYKCGVFLCNMKNESLPHTAGYGNFGLRYDSPFFEYIAQAFKWPGNMIYMKLWINSMNNPEKMGWDENGYYTGSQITFNARPEQLVANYDPDKSVWNSITFDNDADKKRWGLDLGDIYYGDNNNKVDLHKGKVCFYPNSPLALYFKDKAKFDALSKANNKDICGTEEPCKTGSKFMNNEARRVNFRFPGSKDMSMNARDHYYDTGKGNLNYGYAHDAELFATGGPCEGFEVAIGGRFFSRYSIYIRMNLKKENAQFLLIRQISPDKGPPIYSIFLYVWLSFIGLLLYGCVFNHVLRKRTPEVYKGGEKEGGNNFTSGDDGDLDDDGEIVGYVR